MSERRQEEFDRDFSAMVSGLQMDGFSPASPVEPIVEPPDLRAGHDFRPDAPTAFNLTAAMDDAEQDEPDPSEYTPPPLPPVRVRTRLAAFGWTCAGYVLLALILTIAGVRLPVWAGWLAVIAFVAAILIGWRSLPRERDSDDDGAVV